MKNQEKKGKKGLKIFGKVLLCLLAVIVVCIVAVVVTNTVYSNKILSYIEDEVETAEIENQKVPKKENLGYYTFTTDDDLRVMQLTDIHIGGGFLSYGRDMKAVKSVAKMVQTEKPDLVVITGDIAYPVPYPFPGAGTFNNKTGAKIFGNLMDKLGVYWAPSFGNHDTELYSYFDREYIADYYENHKYLEDGEKSYCLFQAGEEDINGYGNYVINVKNSQGVITQSIFMMDTGSYVDGDYLGMEWKYDGIHADQMKWYEETLNTFEAENEKLSAGMPKSMMFFHIPFEEYETAWNEYKENGFEDTENVKYYYGEVGELDGMIGKTLHPDETFETLLRVGSTQAVFCGHDHLNNFSIEYKGIRLSYGYSIDYLAYADIEDFGLQRGCSIITIKPDGSFDSHIENYYQDKYDFEDRDSAKLEKYHV